MGLAVSINMLAMNKLTLGNPMPAEGGLVAEERTLLWQQVETEADMSL